MRITSAFHIVFIAGALISVLAGCPSSNSEPAGSVTAEESRDLQTELASTLTAYQKACVDGDVQTFRRLRCSRKLQRLEAALAKQGRTLEPDNLRGPFASVPDLSGWAVTHCRVNRNHARIQFAVPEDADIPDFELTATQTGILLAVFEREANVWKVVAFTVMPVETSQLDAQGGWPAEAIPQPIRNALEYEALSETTDPN